MKKLEKLLIVFGLFYLNNLELIQLEWMIACIIVHKEVKKYYKNLFPPSNIYNFIKIELHAINAFLYPREKIECLLNCCRIINCK